MEREREQESQPGNHAPCREIFDPPDESIAGRSLATSAALEAMKMQNDLKAPISGTVKKVHVSVGQNVEATTVLVEVEAAAE